MGVMLAPPMFSGSLVLLGPDWLCALVGLADKACGEG